MESRNMPRGIRNQTTAPASAPSDRGICVLYLDLASMGGKLPDPSKVPGFVDMLVLNRVSQNDKSGALALEPGINEPDHEVAFHGLRYWVGAHFRVKDSTLGVQDKVRASDPTYAAGVAALRQFAATARNGGKEPATAAKPPSDVLTWLELG